jgi:hypothetical protein
VAIVRIEGADLDCPQIEKPAEFIAAVRGFLVAGP